MRQAECRVAESLAGKVPVVQPRALSSESVNYLRKHKVHLPSISAFVLNGFMDLNNKKPVWGVTRLLPSLDRAWQRSPRRREAVSVEGGSSRTEFPRRLSLPVRVYRRLPRFLRVWIALATGFGCELRSFWLRTRLRYERGYGRYPVPFLPSCYLAPSGDYREDMRSRACMSDIESFLSERPWATVVDQEVYRDGWLAGAEWSVRNPLLARERQAVTPDSSFT